MFWKLAVGSRFCAHQAHSTEWNTAGSLRSRSHWASAGIYQLGDIIKGSTTTPADFLKKSKSIPVNHSSPGHQDALTPENQRQGMWSCTPVHPSQCEAGEALWSCRNSTFVFSSQKTLHVELLHKNRCWATLITFKTGQQQVQNAKEEISCLSPQKQRAESSWTGILLYHGHRHMPNVVHWKQSFLSTWELRSAQSYELILLLLSLDFSSAL